MYKIVGIGSCLSERVAHHYSVHHCAKLITMVRHNRSDQLVDTILNGNVPPDLEQLRAYILGHEESRGGFSNDIMLRGQASGHIGRSTKPELTDFGSVLASSDVDLILIDNFMDLVSHLWRAPDGTKFFARLPAGVFPRIGKLSAERAAINYERIMLDLQKRWPNAMFVFMHFPFSNYPTESGRPEWGAEFARIIKIPSGIRALPPMIVPYDKLANRDPQHYHKSVYQDIARQVHRWVRER